LIAAIKIIVDDKAATYAGAQGDAYQIADPLAGAFFPFG